MQRPGTVGILGVLHELQPEQGLLATRGGFIECLAGFNIVQIGTSPYPTFTLVSALWSGVAITAAAMLSCCGYLGIGILGISHALVMLWMYKKPHFWPLRLV